jgi:hypothetical protein
VWVALLRTTSATILGAFTISIQARLQLSFQHLVKTIEWMLKAEGASSPDLRRRRYSLCVVLDPKGHSGMLPSRRTQEDGDTKIPSHLQQAYAAAAVIWSDLDLEQHRFAVVGCTVHAFE